MKISNYSVRILNANSNPIQEKDGGYCPIKHKEQYKIALKNFSENDASAELFIDGVNCGFYLLKAKSKLIIDSPNVGEDDGLFTFYKIDSEEGELISEDVDHQNFGLVQVKFVAIKKDTNPEQIKTVINNYFNYGTYRWWIDYYYDRYTYPGNITPIWRVNDIRYMHIGDTSANNTHTTVNDTPILTNTTYTPLFSTTLNQVKEFQNGTAGVITGLQGYSDKMYEKPKETDLLLLDTLTTINLRLIASDDVNQDQPRKITGFSNPIPPALF